MPTVGGAKNAVERTVSRAEVYDLLRNTASSYPRQREIGTAPPLTPFDTTVDTTADEHTRTQANETARIWLIYAGFRTTAYRGERLGGDS